MRVVFLLLLGVAVRMHTTEISLLEQKVELLQSKLQLLKSELILDRYELEQVDGFMESDETFRLF